MPGRHLGKRAVLRADVPEVGLGERRLLDRALQPRLPDLDHAVRVAKGKRRQQRRVEDAEDDGAGAHAQRQHDRAENGQAGIAPQSAQRLPQLPSDRFERGAAANVADTLLDLFRTAEFEQGFAPCCARIAACPHLLVFQHLPVGPNLVIEIALDLSSVREVTPQRLRPMPEPHGFPRDGAPGLTLNQRR